MNAFLKHFSLWMGLLLLTVPLHHLLPHLGIKVVYNPGFIFGSFADSSIYFRLVGISVIGGLIAVVASFFYAYLPGHLSLLRWGMTLLLTGMSGNILEKIVYGKVWDFIKVTIDGTSYFYNLNDLYQWLGMSIITWQIFKNQDEIWASFKSGQRKKLFIYRELQLSIMAKIMGVAFLASLTQALLAITLFFPHLGDFGEDIKLIYLLSFLGINLVLLPMLGYFLLKELLRCVRPVYVLHQKFKSTDHFTPLRLRKDDHFQHVAESYNEFIERMKKQ